MKTNIARTALLFLLGFLSLGALGGGACFILSPSGALMQMPVTMLNNSPFADYLIPGIVLFIVLGIVPLLLIIALLKRWEFRLGEATNFFNDMHWAWSYTIYIAFALIIWLQLEMVFISTVHWFHTFYMFYAVAIIFFALLPQVRHQYKKQVS